MKKINFFNHLGSVRVPKNGVNAIIKKRLIN